MCERRGLKNTSTAMIPVSRGSRNDVYSTGSTLADFQTGHRSGINNFVSMDFRAKTCTPRTGDPYRGKQRGQAIDALRALGALPCPAAAKVVVVLK